MSIMRCTGCERNIDTDLHDMEHNDAGDWCERCMEAHMEEGRELAREHHMDLNCLGCTCRWIGANGDPDQHIQRDDNCPLHGRDPDADRDAMQERY